MNITLPDRNNLGKKEYTAIWQERQPDKWNITYILNGGSVSGNPTEYKRSDLPITLNNPEKAGYTFTGWTGSNGETPSAHVVIPRGTEGDLRKRNINSGICTTLYMSCVPVRRIINVIETKNLYQKMQ